VNRRALLAQTLEAFAAILTDVGDQVECIVIDNASEDDTAAWLRSFAENNPSFRVICESQRLDVDDSFVRCVGLSTGEYICLFGDDDIPYPHFLKKLLSVIENGGAPAFLYMNRLIGDHDLSTVGEVAHPKHGLDDVGQPVATFIREFTHGPGFISSLVFRRDVWERGTYAYMPRFEGYKFLSRVYAGSKGKECVYIGLPSLIQRRGIQIWKARWPRFWLVNMPSLLQFVETEGVTRGAVQYWAENEVSMKRLLIDCLVAKAFHYSPLDPFWREARQFHRLPKRLIISAVQWMVPAFLMNFLYFRVSKYRHASGN
jgi:glycosyltransferase involved in cell wall biosynthesis